jgi:hypothetical protein
LTGQISSEDIAEAISEVWQLFSAEGGTDQIAKGPQFKELLKDKVKNKIQTHFQPSLEAESSPSLPSRPMSSAIEGM